MGRRADLPSAHRARDADRALLVERTLALLVAFPAALGRALGERTGPDVTPISSDAATLASALRAFAAEGVGHVQLVLDPITVETIAALAPALALLDA